MAEEKNKNLGDDKPTPLQAASRTISFIHPCSPDPCV